MKKGLSELVLIIDKSGSMWSIRDDTIGGYNTYINEQKKLDGEAKVTTVFFSSDYQVLNECEDIREIKDLNTDNYKPNGSTALLYTVGSMIEKVGKRLSNTPECKRPEKVIFSILTDGEENTSNQCTPIYTREKIKEMIEHQEKQYKWEFVFLGANQDAFAEASSIGIRGVNTVNYCADSKGTRGAFSKMSKMSGGYRNKT
jgi:hypothetical protein